MQNNSQNKMAVEPVGPLMFRIGLPIVLSMILQAAYNVVDSAYLARMPVGGEDALTALSLAFPVQLFMVAVSIGTGVGTNALLAKLLGLGDRENANRTAGNAQMLGIVISVIFMLFSLLGVRPYVNSQSAGGSISSVVLENASTTCTSAAASLSESCCSRSTRRSCRPPAAPSGPPSPRSRVPWSTSCWTPS